MMLRAALFMLLLLSACQSVGVPMVDRGPVDQSIVFLIHGDADYLFHDSDGVAHLADVEALEKAKRVGMRNPNAEVFIFHQRPRKRLLFLFPRDDGTFYHFRGGVLLAEETYKRGMGPAWLEAELDYYSRLRSASAVLNMDKRTADRAAYQATLLPSGDIRITDACPGEQVP